MAAQKPEKKGLSRFESAADAIAKMSTVLEELKLHDGHSSHREISDLRRLVGTGLDLIRRDVLLRLEIADDNLRNPEPNMEIPPGEASLAECVRQARRAAERMRSRNAKF